MTQCSCYTKVWRGLACFVCQVYQYLEVEQCEFHASFLWDSERFKISNVKRENMKKIKLFIASSLDGYIARSDGALDWLPDFLKPSKNRHGYDELMDAIDTIIMGSKTYHEIIESNFDWPYKTKTTYVISHRNTNLNENDNVNHDLIDEMQICYVPAILGEGISLFPNKPKESKWEIVKTQIYDSGMLKVDYQKQNK